MLVFEYIVLALVIIVIIAAFLYTRGESRTNMKLVDQFKADGNTVVPQNTPATGVPIETSTSSK